MIIDLKRSIDLRWLFDPVLSFILRWSCSMTSSLKQLAKIRSVEAVEMRDSASNRKRRGQIYAKVFQTNLPLSANLLTEPQVLLSHNFLSRQYVLHTKYVVPKEKWLGLLTLRLSRKSDAALQIICQKILLISKTCSESSSDFFAPFISEIALKRIVHRLSNIFLSQTICNSIALFWGDNSQ